MNCKEGNQEIANQIINLLESLDDQVYTQSLAVFNGSTLGQHVRHIIDFYHCLLNGIEKGLVDYADRKRDLRIEQNPSFAREAFLDLHQLINPLEEEEKVRVRADFSSLHSNNRPIVPSSIGRELMFAYDHAVHHLAIIKIGIRTAFPMLNIEENLGVAPSTIKYRAGENASDGRS